MRFLSIALPLALAVPLAGCLDDYQPEYDDPERAALGGKADSGFEPLIDGTPSAVGVLRLLNEPSTTFEMLDHDARLDRRAAEGLIAHRAGPDGVFEGGLGDDDLFDSIAEVDGVYYVGAVSLQRLFEFALWNDFVPGGGQFLGEWDGVRFSVDEAERTLAFVNTATPGELHEALNDSRPVTSIVAARPLASMLQVSRLYYVGPVMMQRLKDAADPGADGVACMSNGDCPAPYRCIGRPDEYQAGACRDLTPLPGEGDECFAAGDCGDGLICSGLLVFGDLGWCRPAWMGATFHDGGASSIPGIVMDTPTTQLQTVWGLASVPEDIAVTVNLEHTDPSSLVIKLVDPNGTEGMVWNGPAMGSAPFVPYVLVNNGISRDERVNGLWGLSIQNVGGRGQGSLKGWDLHLTSRWD
jgi:hypothetical protein